MATSRCMSCEDLQQSIFLAPNEIRTCCKRFFYRGKMQGDVELFKITDSHNPTPQDIFEAKQKLRDDINNGVPNPCTGCPWLRKDNWDDFSQQRIKHISFEQHSICNMRCSYCSDMYYGGKRPNYDVYQLYIDLRENSSLEECKSVVWGGGEPTVTPDFKKLMETVVSDLDLQYNNVFSNSLKFSPMLSKLLAEGKASLITSMDAGTPETFKQVRGVKGYQKVLIHLKRYFEEGAKYITIKYILTDGNHGSEDIGQFLADIEKFDLKAATFQISSDFKHEKISTDAMHAAMRLLTGLRQLDVQGVNLDDHLYPRFAEFASANISLLHEQYKDLLVDPNQFQKVIVWGAGQYAHRMITTSNFFRNVEIGYFVDINPEKQGQIFWKKEVRAPENICKDKLPILIGVNVRRSQILEKLDELGVDSNRLLKGFVI